MTVARAAPRAGYQPALDGLRAIAVIAVLLFHGGVSRAGGGFLGVSLFFTLSGYLITTLLLREYAARGTLSLGSFWARRVRRLAPALLVTVAAVVATAPLWLDPSQQAQLPGDAFASIFDVANWHYAFASRAYADLFATPSPLLHIWSLAIEEQFYVLLPLLLVVVLGRRGTRRVRAVGLAAVALFGLATAAALLTRDSTLAYYGTHTRVAELLAGVILAVALFMHPINSWPRTAVRAGAVGGVVGLAVFATLITVTGTDSVWLDHGGFSAVSVVWVAIIVGVLVPGAPRRVLRVGALAAVGRISYGIYLLHWPLFLVLDQERTGLDGVALLTLRSAVTVALAAALYRWLEQPIRHPAEHRVPRRVGPQFAAALTAVAALVMVMPSAAGKGHNVADVPHTLVRFAGGSTAAPPPPPAPLRVVVVGSDPAIAMRLATASPDLHITVINATDPGCPVFRDDSRPSCQNRATPAQMAQLASGADVGVLALGPEDRKVVQGLAASRWGPIAAGARMRLTTLVGLGMPIVVADNEPGGATDAPGNLVSEVMLHARGATKAATDEPNVDLVQTVVRAARPSADTRVRVLVIGDSTSYVVARDLDAQAHDRLDVLWAGQDNCPLVAGYANRWGGTMTNRTDTCPSVDRGWPDIVASFGPQVVIAMDSLPELAEQRYDPADRWHIPGDPAWRAAHDAVLDRLVALLQPRGAVLYVADAPPITTGTFAKSGMASPARIRALNAEIASWDERSPSVVTLPIAKAIVGFERDAGHSLRPDGVHLDDEGAERLVREVVLPAVATTT